MNACGMVVTVLCCSLGSLMEMGWSRGQCDSALRRVRLEKSSSIGGVRPAKADIERAMDFIVSDAPSHHGPLTRSNHSYIHPHTNISVFTNPFPAASSSS